MNTSYRELVARIEATDCLIDLVVYKLYGLTEEEVAVVEGGQTSRANYDLQPVGGVEYNTKARHAIGTPV